jgi:hypothetical protein
MPEKSPSGTPDLAGLVPLDGGQKIVILGSEIGKDQILDLSGEPDGVQVVKKLPDGRILLRRDYGGGKKIRFAMATPRDFRLPTQEESARIPRPGVGSKEAAASIIGMPLAGEEEKPIDYLLRASPQMAFQAAAHLLPVPVPAKAGVNIFKRILPHAVRAGKVAAITGATSAGEQFLRKGSVDPGEVASEALTYPAAELGMAAGSETVRSAGSFVKKYAPSRVMLEAFWKEGKLPLELSGKGEVSQGRVMRRGLTEAHEGALRLHDEALGKFDASGGTVDARPILDHVEAEMKDPKEAANYFQRLTKEIYGEGGKVPKLVPPYPDLDAINRGIAKENAKITKQAEQLNKGILKRNAQRMKGIDKVPEVGGQRQMAISGLGLETSIEPQLKELETAESIHAQWRKESEKLLEKTPARSLNRVRSFLEKDATGDQFSNKTKAAQRALDEIDNILSGSEAHPYLEEAQAWKDWANRIKGKKSAGRLAELMAIPSEEGFARAVNSSPEKSIEFMQMLRSPEAEMTMSPQMRDRSRKQIRNAWASKAVSDPEGVGKVNFSKISDTLDLTDEARKEILKGNYDHPSIPKNVREIFSWDEEGQGILRRLSFLSMISDKLAEGSRSRGFLRRITAYETLSTAGAALSGHPKIAMLGLATIAATNIQPILGKLAVAKMLYSDVGTEELARWVQMQNKIENAAMLRGLKPGSSAWEKLRKQAGLELNLTGATRMFEAAIAAKEAYRLSGVQKDQLKAKRPLDSALAP